MRKFMALVGVAVLLGLLVSSGTEVAAGKGHVIVRGHGTLYAKGAGFAEIHGDGSVVIQGHGVGAVWVKGAEALHAQGHGQRQPHRGGVLFTGWKGQIKVGGRNVAVRVKGGMIEFTAQGTGRALLVGIGTYKIGNKSGHWLADGIVIEYRP
jgi:hypothetical protein